jgi:hypothetical protein
MRGFCHGEDPLLHCGVIGLLYMRWQRKERSMETIFHQQTHVEHIRKKIFSLFTICIMEVERKTTMPDLGLVREVQHRTSERVMYGKDDPCIIDLTV